MFLFDAGSDGVAETKHFLSRAATLADEGALNQSINETYNAARWSKNTAKPFCVENGLFRFQDGFECWIGFANLALKHFTE